jgi:hypothetical protein
VTDRELPTPPTSGATPHRDAPSRQLQAIKHPAPRGLPINPSLSAPVWNMSAILLNGPKLVT